ncbi:hypothetical protein KC323_g111 [Hortaea werneckii]|nr:hypothetical protein KC323_g111 [Hortaea werneckii]
MSPCSKVTSCTRRSRYAGMAINEGPEPGEVDLDGTKIDAVSKIYGPVSERRVCSLRELFVFPIILLKIPLTVYGLPRGGFSRLGRPMTLETSVLHGRVV